MTIISVVDTLSRSTFESFGCLVVTRRPGAIRRPSPSYDWRLSESFVVAELSGRLLVTFMGLVLDTLDRHVSGEAMFKCSVDSALVYNRLVAAKALTHQVTCVVVAHNHPSGASEPSHSDIAVTQKLAKALMLLVHFIVADGRCISLRNLGVM